MARPRKVTTTTTSNEQSEPAKCKTCVFYTENALTNISFGYCTIKLPPAMREFQNRGTHPDESCDLHKEK